MGKWVITGLVVVVLAVGALTTGWWAAPLLAFVGANSDLIQGVASLIQMVLWIAAGAVALIGVWRAQGSHGTTQSAGKRRTVTTTEERSVAIGGAAASNQITAGDNNHVTGTWTTTQPPKPKR